ncbi:MAG: SPOR domain-containing protein [Gemmatimonadales bacterium]
MLAACGRGTPTTARHVPNGLPADVSLLQLPRDGGVAQLLRADSLTSIDWHTTGVPPIVRALGTDREEKMVYAVDTAGRLIGLDLRAQRWRPYLQSAHQLTGTADGVVLGLDSARRPLRLASRALTTYRSPIERGAVQLLGASGAQIVAVSASQRVAQVVDEDGETRRVTLPAGELSGTWAGDLLAVTTDSGVVLAEPSGKKLGAEFISVRGNPTVSVFSPSGHRLYIARRKNDIEVLDRFSRAKVRTFALPGTATALRVDRTGRWLLARPDQGDSVWVVDLVRWEIATTLRTRWAEDLPLVAAGRTLIARDGKDVVAFDLTAATPKERSRLVGAAGDVFLAVPWAPAGAVAEVAVASNGTPAAADTVNPTTDSSAAPPAATTAAPVVDPIPTAPTGSGASSVFLQVASSQNQDWAGAFAQQLKEGGFPARVLAPKSAGDPYKVVIGPYATRDEADAVGRRLGRPYFLLTPGAGET